MAIALAFIGCGSSLTSAGSVPVGAQPEPAVVSELAGIPQHGQLIGSETAPVRATLFGDLECPSCRDFVLGKAFSRLLANQVGTGELAIVYRSLCTETCSGLSPTQPTTQYAAKPAASVFTTPTVPIPAATPPSGPEGKRTFTTQQVAAYAAGLQGRFWEFAMVFLRAQRRSGGGYVTEAFLDKLARETPGLVYQRWLADRRSPVLARQVGADEAAATRAAVESTPTLVFRGRAGTRTTSPANASYRSLAAALRSVS
jgi:protein-disulfide isomerase